MSVRLIDHLKSLGLTPREARRALSSGKVSLNSVPTADAGRLVDPERIRYDERAPRLRVGVDPAVVWRDDHLAVVWKPAGLLSVAAPRRGKDPNLVSLMARLFGEAHPVHRLDEGTSGLIIVARSAKVRQAMIPKFAAHEIERGYLALVQQTFPDKPLTVRNTIVADRGDGRRGAGEGPGGVTAATHFRRVAVLQKSASLVEARLETGRKHQVRIHLAELGYPVLGDNRYGQRRSTMRARRLALHAYRLGFKHPVTNEQLSFEAPLADDLEHLMRVLNGQEAPPPPRKPRAKPVPASQRKKARQKKNRRKRK